MGRAGRWMALAVLALSLAGCSMRQLIYPAPPVPVGPPPEGFVEARIALAGGGFVHAWHRPREGAQATLLYFHGNGENLETLRRSGLLAELGALPLHLLLVDYPGYGRSPGRPSEGSVRAAAAAAFDWLAERHSGAGRWVAGWSLGAAAAVGLASERAEEVDGLVLMSPWSSLREAASYHFPGLLVRLVLADAYDSVAAAAGVRCPALVIHGREDAIIPVEQGRRVAAALGEQARWLEVAGAGHNDLLARPLVWSEVAGFTAARTGILE